MSTIIIEIPPFLDIVVAVFSSTFGFLIGRVAFRYMFLPWLGKKMANWLAKKMEPTPRDEIIIRHYRARSRGQIHQAAWPWHCPDGKCPQLK